MKPSRLQRIRNQKGTNQYKVKKRFVDTWQFSLIAGFSFILFLALVTMYIRKDAIETAWAQNDILSPVATSTPTPTPIASPTPTELEEVVAYITKKFEPEGKHVVVKAINCFYSESGLRPNAVGQNNDAAKSKDHGIAQLNSYWHKLTDAEKTEIKANIDRAYKIYKSWGNNFNAWYGKGCK